MNQFSCFTDATILKSRPVNDGKVIYELGGILSHTDKDIDNHNVHGDYDVFLSGRGKLKYEHKEIKGPDAFIGFPISVEKKGKATHFIGETIPFHPTAPDEELTVRERLARSTVHLIEEMNAFNNRHPELKNKQRGGWSVEGSVKSHDRKTGKVVAEIQNVVFTTKPRHDKTFAYAIQKSLDVDYGITPQSQVGMDAIRLESLKGNNSNKKGENKKMQFKNRSEAYKYFLVDEKLSAKEALDKANEWQKENSDAIEKSIEIIDLGAKDRVQLLEKSNELVKDVLDQEFVIDVKGHAKKLEKSKDSLELGKDLDPTIFLTDMQDAMLDVTRAVNNIGQAVQVISKSIELQNLAGIKEASSSSADALITSSLLGEMQEVNQKMNAIYKSLAGEIKPLSTDNLSHEENDDPKKPFVLEKSQEMVVLRELAKNGEIDQDDVLKRDQNLPISEKSQKLVKSKAAEILKLK